VIVCSVAFLALTADTLSQVPARTKAQNLTTQVVAGKQAWQRHDCIGCHTILGNRAYHGPDLTKIAQTQGTAFLRTWLKNPAGQMPNQRLTDQEVEDLVARLAACPAGSHAHPSSGGDTCPQRETDPSGSCSVQEQGLHCLSWLPGRRDQHRSPLKG
jgi:mono/diheme cytochrome c family protein